MSWYCRNCCIIRDLRQSRKPGKPRPAVIVQDDGFEGADSLVVCPFTSDGRGGAFVPASCRAESGQRASRRTPLDGRQDHRRPQVEDGSEDRFAKRRRRCSAQPIDTRIPWTGGLFESKVSARGRSDSRQQGAGRGCDILVAHQRLADQKRLHPGLGQPLAVSVIGNAAFGDHDFSRRD
jgi:PemK-like, MazF-like toxin of type II toxin-antitoxin system